MDELDYMAAIGIVAITVVVFYMVTICIFAPFL